VTAPIYLVDASIYIFRAYFSIPDVMTDKNGNPVNAVYGYTNFLLDLLELRPEYISFAFDESLNSCYRNDIFPDYKGNRELPDENLKSQIEKCLEITHLLGMHFLSLQRYEADDIIGTLHTALGVDRPVIIVTRDKDLGQLLRVDDVLWDFAANIRSGLAEIKEKFGVYPHQIADYLALAGDPVDNIPGAPGIGAKSAAKILDYFGDIDSLYASIDDIDRIGIRGFKKIKITLMEYENRIRMFRKITSIKCDIELTISLKDVEPSSGDLSRLWRFCDEMGFGQRIRRRLTSVAQFYLSKGL